MTTVLNPLAYNDIGTPVYYWLPLGTRNRIHYHTFLVETQKAAIREASGKRNGKRETDFKKTRSPGRSGKLPGRFPGRDASTASPVSIAFPPVSPTPDSPNLDHASISWSKVATREATMLALLRWHQSLLKAYQWHVKSEA